MDRRGFMKSILAAGVAPAFIGSSILMPVRKLLTPTFVPSGTGATTMTAQEWLRLHGDGVTDDSAALQAWLDGEPVLGPDGQLLGSVLTGGIYRVGDTIQLGPWQTGKLATGNVFVGPVPKDKPMFYVHAEAPSILRDVYIETTFTP